MSDLVGNLGDSISHVVVHMMLIQHFYKVSGAVARRWHTGTVRPSHGQLQ